MHVAWRTRLPYAELLHENARLAHRVHHAGIGDENDDERDERVDDEVHPREVEREEIIVRGHRWPNEIRAAHGQQGRLRLVVRESTAVLLLRPEEDQVVQIEKEQRRVDDDQRAVRMLAAEHVLVPDEASGDCRALQRDRAENPHGAVREVVRDELVRSTEVDRTLEKVRLERVPDDQTNAVQGDQDEILERLNEFSSFRRRERESRERRCTMELSATNRIEQPNFWNFLRVNIKMVSSEPMKPKGKRIHG